MSEVRSPEEIRAEMIDTQLDELTGIEDYMGNMDPPESAWDTPESTAVMHLSRLIAVQIDVQIAHARIMAIGLGR